MFISELTGHQIDVRIFNTNTQQTISETIQLSPEGRHRDDGDCSIPGVEGTSSPIKVAFLDPEGSMTGKMLPSGATQETFTVHSKTLGTIQLRVSLVDAGNPFVLVDSRSLRVKGYPTWPAAADPDFMLLAEDIRREGAVRFGLASDVKSASVVRGTPKIAFLSPPADISSDIDVLAFTMGKPHPSIQITGAVCIGAAAAIHGTVAWQLAHGSTTNNFPKHGLEIDGQRIASPSPVRIRHPAGVTQTETTLGVNGKGDIHVRQVGVLRTARRLFEGNVFYKI
jgi:2-methylaconitate cis-trans-isomerase PrpF